MEEEESRGRKRSDKREERRKKNGQKLKRSKDVRKRDRTGRKGK